MSYDLWEGLLSENDFLGEMFIRLGLNGRVSGNGYDMGEKKDYLC